MISSDFVNVRDFLGFIFCDFVGSPGFPGRTWVLFTVTSRRKPPAPSVVDSGTNVFLALIGHFLAPYEGIVAPYENMLAPFEAMLAPREPILSSCWAYVGPMLGLS